MLKKLTNGFIEWLDEASFPTSAREQGNCDTCGITLTPKTLGIWIDDKWYCRNPHCVVTRKIRAPLE